MRSLIDGVKKLSAPMFVVFVTSKALVGIGIGVLFAQALAPYGWLFLGVGVAVSIWCAVLAAKNM